MTANPLRTPLLVLSLTLTLTLATAAAPNRLLPRWGRGLYRRSRRRQRRAPAGEDLRGPA